MNFWQPFSLLQLWLSKQRSISRKLYSKTECQMRIFLYHHATLSFLFFFYFFNFVESQLFYEKPNNVFKSVGLFLVIVNSSPSLYLIRIWSRTCLVECEFVFNVSLKLFQYKKDSQNLSKFSTNHLLFFFKSEKKIYLIHLYKRVLFQLYFLIKLSQRLHG